MAPHYSTLAWKIPWTEEPGGLQSMGSLRVGHNWATSLSLFTFMHWRRKWPSVLAWRIPGKGEPGGLPSMGPHRVGYDWCDLAAAARLMAISYISRICHSVCLKKKKKTKETHLASILRQTLCEADNKPWLSMDLPNQIKSQEIVTYN